MAKFSGFPRQSLTFLRGLAKHNDKAWFQAHRAEYEAHVLEPAKALVEVLGERLRKSVPGVQSVPRIDGSIFRINRDVRFSTDKRPYKTHLELWLWEGSDRSEAASGFYVRLTPRALVLGAGIHQFSREQLLEYRVAVHDEERGAALMAVQDELRRSGHALQGQGLRTVPRGFDREHPRASLLRHRGLFAGPTLSPLPDAVHDGRLPKLCASHFEKLAPLHRWLVEHTARAGPSAHDHAARHVEAAARSSAGGRARSGVG